MWGRGPRGNSAACSALCRFLVTSTATHKQIGPFWCWFPGGWFCVCSRTLWVSPTNSPVSLEVSPTGVFSQRFWLYFPILEHWVVRSVSLPSCSSQFICTRMWDCPVCKPLPCLPGPPAAALLPISTPPTSLDECFFFNSWLSVHTVRFSVGSGCFLFLNLVVFFWLWEEAQCVYLCLHLGWKSIIPFSWLFSKRDVQRRKELL